MFKGETWRVWMAYAVAGSAAPGEVMDTAQGIVVGCGKGALRITELQKAGGKRMSARDFLVGNPVKPGECFA
jgi:methionyl-tRNA formyltransferase